MCGVHGRVSVSCKILGHIREHEHKRTTVFRAAVVLRAQQRVAGGRHLSMNRIILSIGILLSFLAIHGGEDGSRGLSWAIAVLFFAWSLANDM